MSTRLTLRTNVRTELQETTPGFWQDSELNGWLDEAHAEIVAATRQDAISSFTLAANTESYALPADFFLARRVEIQTSPGSVSSWIEVKPYSLDLRRPGDPLNTTTQASTPVGYYILDGKLYFVPVPDQAYSADLYYFKNATPFTSDTDTPSYPEGIPAARVDNVLTDYVVAKALTKRQDPAYTVYAGRYDAGLLALSIEAQRRGMATSDQVVDDWLSDI